jgi:DNA-binding transcriptional MerR regulator
MFEERMNTSDVIKKTGIPRQKLYYLEQKGYISPKKTHVGEKAFREFDEIDVQLIHWIWTYLKDGFRYRIAYEKALKKIGNPNHGND